MLNHIFYIETEKAILNAATKYCDKANFDMYAELFKCGVISRKEFVKRVSEYVKFDPEIPSFIPGLASQELHPL